MESPDFARNLYLTYRLGARTRRRLATWDAEVLAAPRLPSTRWHQRQAAFLRAASSSASTQIEGNQLSLWAADELLGGLRPEGSAKDRREVRNYSEALDLAIGLSRREPFEWHELLLQQLNAAVLRGLEADQRGAYRSVPVTAGGGFYLAPNAAAAPALMGTLVEWLRATGAHPLVRSALLHLNLVAIHPWLDGNGRTTRLATLIDVDRVVRATELVSIEPALAADRAGYFGRIRHAVGLSWDPENHDATEWIDWYVELHVDALRRGGELNEAALHDIVVILEALERRGEPADWGPIILTSAFGTLVAGRVQRMYRHSSSAARAMIGRLVEAGWLTADGATRGRVYHPSGLVTDLPLRSPEAARRWALTPPR